MIIFAPMFRNTGIYFVISILSLVAVSCSNYQKIQKSQDFRFKFEKALEYYDREDYFRAINLFDQVLPFYRGTAEAEDIAYKHLHEVPDKLPEEYEFLQPLLDRLLAKSQESRFSCFEEVSDVFEGYVELYS